MLKRLYQFCLERIAGLERELFFESRQDSDVLRLRGKKAVHELARALAFLTAGIKYIFFQFLLALVELAVLVAMSPKEGYELFSLSSPLSLSSPRLPAQAGKRGSSLDSRLHGNDRGGRGNDRELGIYGYPTSIDYEEYERKHRRTRWFSVGTFSVAVAAVVVVSLVVNLILPVAPSVLGATNTFTQTNWGGGSSSNNAIHPTNQSAWSQYSSASSEITAVNGGEDLELVPHSASSTQTTDTQFNAGTYSTTTVSGSGSSASVKLSKALHINEYTIGALSNIAVTASTITTNSNGTWTIAFSGTPNLARLFKNDKFTDSASKAWKVLSVAPNVYKIIVVDSQGNTPVVSAPATGSGTVGRWYASISAWEAGRQGDITANDRNAIERGLPYYDGAPDTTAVTIDGWTTDATHYIEIYVPLSERHRGKWDTGKYRLEVYAQNSAALHIAENYVRVEGLQLQKDWTTYTSSNLNGINYTGTGEFQYSHNVIRGTVTTGTPSEGLSAGIQLDGVGANATVKIWNNIIYGCGYGIDWNYGAAVSGAIYNNTVANCFGTGIIFRGSVANNNVYLKNNIVQGSATNYNVFSLEGTANNISEDATSPDGASYQNKTVPFVDSANNDFHLDFRDGTGNPAMNAGADLSADANLSFSTDIDGDARSSAWDIGADDVGATLVMTHSIGNSTRDFQNLAQWEDIRGGQLTTRKVFKISNQSAAFQKWETVTGSISGATGSYIAERYTPSASETYMALDAGSGTFVTGETLTGATSGATTTLSTILTTAGTIEKGEAYNDSTFTAGVTIDGSITNASHYMWLTAEPGSRHRGVAGTGARIVAGTVIGLADNATIFENFEVDANIAAQAGVNFSATGISNGIVRNNIIYRSAQTGGAGISVSYSQTQYIYNNIVYGFNDGVVGLSNSNVYNNVAYNNSSGIKNQNSSASLLTRNNITVGNTTDYNVNSGSWDAASSNNISFDATAPGATGSLTNVATSSVRFVSTASDFVDLHILDGSVAKDAGADLSATFTGDIDGSYGPSTSSGQARPAGSAWDIGADEWFSSSPVYNSSGTFTSATIDFGNPVNFDSLIWNPTSTQPVSGSLKLAVAAKSADSGWADSDFIELNRGAYPSGVTVHTSYIRPSGQCTGYSPCYNSLSAWEAAQNRDLVASNEIEVAQIGGNWASPDITAVTIDGWTTDATHYIRIYTAPESRHNGKWDNGKYRINSSSNRVIDIQEPYTRIEGLQIDGGIVAGIFYNSSIAGGAYASQNIIKNSGTGFYDVSFIYNNIAYNNATCFRIHQNSVVYNNTAYNCATGFNNNSGWAVIYNNISYNNTDNYYGSYSASSSNNLSGPSQTDAPGTSARNGVSVTFVDAAGSDYRLVSSDAGAKNYGTSSVSEIGFATDIEGHLRSTGGATWDIGAHEYGATGGNIAASLDNNRYLRYKAYFSTADSAFSPQLDDLTVNYTYYATNTPTLISSPYNTNDATNILGKIAWTATTTSGTEARIQVRSAPNSGGVPGTWSQWCGYTACDDSDYFATSTINVDLASGHPLKNGGNDQWLQYKVILVSNGASTPTFGNIVLTYVVNAPPDLQNVTASQRTSDGKVDVVYEVRDTDTATGTTTPGLITPSFSYSTDGGQNWTAITSGYLTAGNLSNKQVCDGTGTYGGLNCAVTQYTQYTATWDAKAQLNGTYATNTKIMVSATDNEGANNSSSVATSAFTLDVKNPVATVTVDGTKDGQAGAVAISSSDDSSLQMLFSNRSDYASDGQNGTSGTWTAISTSLTWTFASGDPVRVYGKIKDAYQNETAVAPDAPNTPANVTIQDTSNLNLSEFREFVSWSVNAAGDFASYKVYRSTDGSSYSLLSTIASAATNYLENGSSGAWLSNGTTYYYKLTAQDSSGNISRYSSAVSDIPDGQGGTDVTPPTISGLSSSAVNTTQATITWTTDELSNSVVYYSTDSSYSSSKSVASMVTAHSATLTGLTPNTAYNFRVRSTDPLSNVSSYATGTPFTTAQGPVISGVTPVAVSGNSATVVWNTNANSDSWVIYSTNSDLSGSQTTGTSTLVGGSGPNYEHRVSLSSLSTNAKYYFKVRSVDGSSNAAEDDNGGSYYTFTTAQDVSAPVISSVSAILSSQTSTVISWLTNEPADSQVVYGLDQNSLTSQTSVNSTMTINHSMILSDLTAGATYYYKVVSADSSANSTQSAVYNFSTTALALENTLVVTRYVESGPPVVIDRTSPLITDVKVDDITESSATITWRTNEEADSFVEYGPPDILGSTRGQRESVKFHRVTLMDLKPNARYAFKATSADASGNVSVSLVVNFQTLSQKTVAEKIGEQIEQSAREKIKDFKIENQDDIARLTKEIEEIIAQASSKVAPPRITGADPKVEVSSSFAVISWVTDRPASSVVAYAALNDYAPGVEDPYKAFVGSADEQVTEHRVVLSDLAPGATYHYQVRSKGLIGGVGKSNDYTFKTTEEGSISGVEIKEITKDSAVIFWRTNIPATTLLNYGMSTSYGLSQFDPALNVSHTAILRNLQPGTFYHFRIGGTDKNDSAIASPDLTFTTESLPSMLNVKIDAVKEREMTVTWYTDVLSDSTVEYTSLKTGKAEAFSDKQMVRNHTLAVTGLEEDAPYKFRAVSRDEKGNEVKSSEYNLQTTRDREPPEIINIQTQSAVSGKDRVQTIVSWRTSEPSSSRVTYQEGVAKNPELERSSPFDNDLKMSHVVVFTDLKPGAVYRLKIESVDAANNAAQSRDLTILTPQRKETVIDLIIKNFQDVFRWTDKIR